jgi:hypothetical protein
MAKDKSITKVHKSSTFGKQKVETPIKLVVQEKSSILAGATFKLPIDLISKSLKLLFHLFLYSVCSAPLHCVDNDINVPMIGRIFYYRLIELSLLNKFTDSKEFTFSVHFKSLPYMPFLSLR